MTSITIAPAGLLPGSSRSDIDDMAPNVVNLVPAQPLTEQRRRHPRVDVNGKIRLVADAPGGLLTVTGAIVDLSVSGCAISVHTPLEPGHEARIELGLDGREVWVPGRIKWTKVKTRAWVVGIEFDRLVPAKQSHLVQVVARRRKYLY